MTMRTSRRRILLALAVTGAAITAATQANAATVHAAIAANFSGALGKLQPLFEACTGHRLVPSFGSTGMLYAQINQGAPFDVFLAADEATPKKLIAKTRAEAASYRIYAVGRLALWSATPGYIDAQGRRLRSGDFSRIAIADRKTAPYGRAAYETLAHLGLWRQLQPKLITGQNIAQTHQFVASGNVPLGFIALAQLQAMSATRQGSFWLIPSGFHSPIRQAAVRMTGSGEAAADFLAFLGSPAARNVIADMGYVTPSAARDSTRPAALCPPLQ